MNNDLIVEASSNLLMQFAGLGGLEWVIIIGLIVVVFFGVRKIQNLQGHLAKLALNFKRQELRPKESFNK